LRESYSQHCSAAERKALELYIEKKREYFISQKFNDEALVIFNEAMNIYGTVLSDRVFDQKKQLLSGQLRWITD